MSDLQINSNPTPNQYQNYIGESQPGSVNKTSENIGGVTSDTSLKIDEQNATTGTTGTTTVTEIPEPEATEADQTTVARLELALTNSIDALFELYSILQLLQECANKQRAATREARQSEYEAEKTSIQRQADQLRTAAIVGLITGVIGSTISILTLAKSMKGLSTGTSTKLDLIDQSDLGTASKNLHNANNKVNGLAQELNDFKADLPTKAPTSQVQEPGIEAPKTPAASSPKTETPSTDAPKTGTPADAPKTGTPEDTPKTGTPADAPKTGTPADAPKTETPEANTDKTAETAPSEEMPTPDSDKLDDNIDRSALTEDQKAKLDQLENDYLAAGNDLRDAQQAFDRALGDLHNNPKYIQADADIQNAQNWMQVGQALGGLGNTLSQTLTQLLNANATLEQVMQKDAEQESEQQNDLFKNAGELRQAVLQLMSAVTQVEKDSMNKIINA